MRRHRHTVVRVQEVIASWYALPCDVTPPVRRDGLRSTGAWSRGPSFDEQTPLIERGGPVSTSGCLEVAAAPPGRRLRNRRWPGAGYAFSAAVCTISAAMARSFVFVVCDIRTKKSKAAAGESWYPAIKIPVA
jgi:hypothetical protein